MTSCGFSPHDLAGERIRRASHAPPRHDKEWTEAPAGEGGRVLLVDDDQTACRILGAALECHHEVTCCASAEDSLDLIAERDFDVILTDLHMKGLGGLELCERIVGMRPDIPVIVVTGYGSLETAVGAIRAGAYDFVTKPIDLNLIGMTVRRAIRHRRLQEEVRRLRVGSVEPAFADIIGSSPAMKRVLDLISYVSSSDATVLVAGETGTGKGLIAKAIHTRSARSSAPFLAISCAAIPAALLETELFGHAGSSPPGAKTQRQGLFLGTKDGTLLLDDIGELPPEVQPKLLRALEERKVRPIGAGYAVPFEARIITATNRDLETEVFEERFHKDLYYRISAHTIDVPPLRERGVDVLRIAHHFVDLAARRSGKDVRGVGSGAAEKMCAYDWPGNVRELENCVERAVALTRFDHVTVEDLPERIRNYRADRFVVAAEHPSDLISAEELERRYILRVLALVGGNKSRAAKILGFNRRTLYRKMPQERGK